MYEYLLTKLFVVEYVLANKKTFHIKHFCQNLYLLYLKRAVFLVLNDPLH